MISATAEMPVVLSRTAARPAAGEYLPALTGLRFVLALWVVLHHISGKGMMLEAWTSSLPHPLPRIIHGGYLAVQTFFILSGFVLARTYARASWNGNSLKKYFAARFARIYPVYLLSLAVVGYFIVAALRSPGRTLALKAGLVADYLLVLQGWTGNLGVGWNTPAWSLSCEFFFYLLFPILFLWMRKMGRGALSAVFVLSIVTPVLLDHARVPWNWKPIYHLSDFVAGIAASRLFDWLSPVLRRRGFWLYVPAIFAGAALIVYPRVMHAIYADLNTGLRPLNVLALVGFALSGGLLARALSTSLLDFLGKASYSLYILHIPVLWWYNRWAMYGTFFGRHLSPVQAASLYLAIGIAAASLSFQYVEMPANRWIRAAVKTRS